MPAQRVAETFMLRCRLLRKIAIEMIVQSAMARGACVDIAKWQSKAVAWGVCLGFSWAMGSRLYAGTFLFSAGAIGALGAGLCAAAALILAVAKPGNGFESNGAKALGDWERASLCSSLGLAAAALLH